MNSFFIVFVDHLDEPGPPMPYRGDGGNVVVYDNRVSMTRPWQNMGYAKLVVEPPLGPWGRSELF